MKKMPLRKRYFWDALQLGGFVLGLSLLVLTLFNANEVYEHAENRHEEVKEMLVLAGVLLATFPVIVWMAWRTSGRLLRPLRDIQAGVKAMKSGDMALRFQVESQQDELTYLVESLNEAFDAHRDAQRRLENFSSNVSHQLRTPLTSMRLAGQVCVSTSRSEGEYLACIGKLLEESERLTRMVDQLLQLAQISSADVSQKEGEAIDLGALTQEASVAFAELAEERDAAWQVQLPEEALWVKGNAVWLREAMANLLNNALSYTPDPARFCLRVFKQDASLVWQIEDNGPGIPADIRPQLFERFHRGEVAWDEGTGLGLAIVSEIIALHGGELSCAESKFGGALFQFSLPLLDS
ncbi:HAMP domain-containing sensor histidine kinase [Kiritimatiellota bacterium B12222]|nr:HAMP domain-containing sensor histidine kinase [Kiritimatiellota bacterium B12222]